MYDDYNTYLAAGIKTPEELRAELGLPPLTCSHGNTVFGGCKLCYLDRDFDQKVAEEWFNSDEYKWYMDNSQRLFEKKKLKVVNQAWEWFKASKEEFRSAYINLCEDL